MFQDRGPAVVTSYKTSIRKYKAMSTYNKFIIKHKICIIRTPNVKIRHIMEIRYLTIFITS